MQWPSFGTVTATSQFVRFPCARTRQPPASPSALYRLSDWPRLARPKRVKHAHEVEHQRAALNAWLANRGERGISPESGEVRFFLLMEAMSWHHTLLV